MKTSIVILTHNQLPMTFQCVSSIRRHTPEDYEIIVVDNGSTDATASYFGRQSDVKLIRNEENRGFAGGCNQGLEAATGDNVLFLNNDTVVTDGWLTCMLRELYREERIGMVGPVTNYASGPQQIQVTYRELSGLPEFAEARRISFSKASVEANRLVGFCLLAKKSVLEEIGPFDERYGLGNYEDDDLCLRALQAGYVLSIALDSFVHHIGHGTFNKMPSETLNRLLLENKRKATEKWGRDITELIHDSPATISLIVPIGPGDDAGQAAVSLESVRQAVEEIVVLDFGADEKVATLARGYANAVIGCESDSESAAEEKALSSATMQFALWWDLRTTLTPPEERRLRGLKRKLVPGEGTVGP